MAQQVNKKRDGFVGGIILVTIGLIALVGQVIDLSAFSNLGLFILPAIGAVMLMSGVINHKDGLIIPGGILSGIGLGILLVAGPFDFVSPENEGGVFMLSFAMGWMLITVLTAVFTNRTHWWALIPGAIMGLIGGTILVGGFFETALSLLGKFWPVALIALGASVLLQSVRKQTS